MYTRAHVYVCDKVRSESAVCAVHAAFEQQRASHPLASLGRHALYIVYFIFYY